MFSKTEAAYKILKGAKNPLHVKEIIKIALGRKLIETKGKTPESTLATDLLLENRRKIKQGIQIRFEKFGPGVWGLIEWKK